jgi:hypothetical protein
MDTLYGKYTYDRWDKTVNFEALKGKTITKIDHDNEFMAFICDDGSAYIMLHEQDCCEGVYIEDICGNLDGIIGTEIFSAECVCSEENPEGVKMDYQDSFTWTFYKISTFNGDVTIRWYGESNGYYSEGVDFIKVSKIDGVDIPMPEDAE